MHVINIFDAMRHWQCLIKRYMHSQPLLCCGVTDKCTSEPMNGLKASRVSSFQSFLLFVAESQSWPQGATVPSWKVQYGHLVSSIRFRLSLQRWADHCRAFVQMSSATWMCGPQTRPPTTPDPLWSSCKKWELRWEQGAVTCGPPGVFWWVYLF